MGSETWREFPEFKFAEPSLSETLGAQSVAIISLHLWTVFAFAGIWLIGKRARI